eukprot:811534-Pelagomonas_calceolata.AAC.5
MQLGCSFFQGMASEFGAQDYGRPALEQWFRPVSDHAATQWSPSSGSPGHGGIISHTARAVLIDMEPKVGQCSGSYTLWRGFPRAV